MDQHTSETKDSGTAVLSISGMTCGGCAKTVMRVLSPVPGGSKVEVDLASARAVAASGARTEDLVGAVETAGYGAQLLNQDAAGVRDEYGRSGCR